MGVFDRLSNAWFLLTTTFSFIGRDKSLLIVPVLLPFVNILAFLAFVAVSFLGVIAVQPQEGFGVSITEFVLLGLLLFVMFFVNTFMGAAHSWMVHEVALGKDTTFASGLRRALHNLGDVFKFAFVMMVVGLITGALRGQQKQGIDLGYSIRSGIAGMIEGVVGILGKLVLPAMIITDKSFGEAVKDLRRSSKAWPEVLTLELGLGPLLVLAAVPLGLLIIAVTFLLPRTAGDWGVAFVILAFGLMIILMNILNTLVSATYYTLLYIVLVEKRKIPGIKDVFYRNI